MPDETAFTYENDDALRIEALAIRTAHDPEHQGDDAWPERCALCHYTRHPCDTYDMADQVLALLDRIAGIESADRYLQTVTAPVVLTPGAEDRLRALLNQEPTASGGTIRPASSVENDGPEYVMPIAPPPRTIPKPPGIAGESGAS